MTTFGDRAEDIAAELARSGCIVLECDFRDARVVLPPRGWAPHPDLHAAREEHSSQRAARRAAQGDEARRLAAELAPYPAAGPLVAILSAQRDGPYRDHAIEAARVLLADGTLPGTGEDAPWVAVRWLKRGKKADYAMSQEPLGEGGQGAVFSAVHKLTDITIALKRLRFGDEDAVHRMGREIYMGNRTVITRTSCRCWMLIRTVGGSSCRTRMAAPPITQTGCGETAALRDLVEAACEGLRQPHADGWTHRDIKPANILLLKAGGS